MTTKCLIPSTASSSGCHAQSALWSGARTLRGADTEPRLWEEAEAVSEGSPQRLLSAAQAPQAAQVGQAGQTAAQAPRVAELTWGDAAILGLIGGIFSQIGDLVQSRLKRAVGVKDSGRFFPGHGGAFDRFDALVFTAPLADLYLHYVAELV